MRLTNDMRDRIERKILAHRFQNAAETIASRWQKLASAVYEDVFTLADRKKMKSLPDGWLPSVDSFAARFAGDYRVLRTAKPVLVPYRCVGAALANYDARHAIAEMHAEIRDEQNALHEERRRLAAQVSALLGSVTTAKKLIEVWPEAKPFVYGMAGNGKTTLPAVNIDQVNKALGLPLDDKAAA